MTANRGAVSSLVIIDDFDIPSHPLSPLKTDPIALITTQHSIALR